MPPLPPVTKALMLICVAVFCLSELLGQFGVFAMTGAGPFPLLDAWFGLWPLRSGSFWPWQVLTYAFLHGGVMHLFFNMLGLWMFGAELERLWGPKRYLHLLLASVLAAAVVQLVFTLLVGSRGPTVGASGGLYGLLLAYALAFRNRQFDLLGLAPMLLMLLPIPGADILGMMLFIVLLTNRQLVPVRSM